MTAFRLLAAGIALFAGHLAVAASATTAKFSVDDCAGKNGVSEKCHYHYRYSPDSCAQGKCSKLLIFFSGGEMKCDQAFADENAAYTKVLKGYNEKGYLAVCAGIFMSATAGGAFPFREETERVDLLVSSITRSNEIRSRWTGDHLLIGGISHGATAPVVAMARTNVDAKPHWKGRITTGACFLDGVYSPVAANTFLKNQLLVETNPHRKTMCGNLRDRAICNRYFGDDTGCPDPSRYYPESVEDDELLLNPISPAGLQIPHWKLVECGSELDVCTGDLVPMAPIKHLCSVIDAHQGKSCEFGQLKDQSHGTCMSTPQGIEQCQGWFDELVLASTMVAPSLIRASDSEADVQMVWTDPNGHEDGYEIERAPQGGVFASLYKTSENVTRYADLRLHPGRYDYRVRAYKRNFASPYSNVLTVTVEIPPAAPVSLTAWAAGKTVALRWTDKSYNETGFEIERRLNGGAVTVTRVPANHSAYQETVTRAGAYTYRVRAYNDTAASDFSNPSTATVVDPPEAPSYLTVNSGIFGLGFRLEWKINGVTQKGFEIERSVDSPSQYVVIGHAGPSEFSFYDWRPGRGTFYFRVRAYNDSGESAYSRPVRIVR